MDFLCKNDTKNILLNSTTIKPTLSDRLYCTGVYLLSCFKNLIYIFFILRIVSKLGGWLRKIQNTLPTEDHTSTGIVCHTDYSALDLQLQNLPSDLYVQKLIELTSSSEKCIIDYRTFFCIKAYSIDHCPLAT